MYGARGPSETSPTDNPLPNILEYGGKTLAILALGNLEPNLPEAELPNDVCGSRSEISPP